MQESEIIFRPYRIFGGKKGSYVKLKKKKVLVKKPIYKKILRNIPKINTNSIDNILSGYFGRISDSYIGKFRDVNNLALTYNIVNDLKKEISGETKQLRAEQKEILNTIKNESASFRKE
jgi:hypothetical protein